MKFVSEQKSLKEAISWVASSLPMRPPTPILAGIILETSDSVLKISSFDYEVSSRIEIPVESSENGKVLLSGNLLDKIVNALPSAPVTIEQVDSHVVVSCQSSKFNLATMPVSDYPNLPELPAPLGLVDSHDFKNAVSQVYVAASKDETFPMLTTIKIEANPEELIFMSSDRYRLAVKKILWNPSRQNVNSVALVKAKTLSEVAKSLGNSGELQIDLAENNDLIGFESGGRHSTSLLIEGNFPDIRQLFPETSPIVAVVKRSDIIEAVRRVSLVIESNTSPLKLTFKDNSVELNGGSGENARASEFLPSKLEGEEISVAFNPVYLSEGLNALQEPYVRFSFTLPQKPVVVTGQKQEQGSSEEDYRYLLMPVRLPQ